MNQYKKLNKYQLPDNIPIITLLNTKLNMYLKLTIPPKLNMFHNKNHILNKFQLPNKLLNMYQKPDIPLNMFHNKEHTLKTFQFKDNTLNM